MQWLKYAVLLVYDAVCNPASIQPPGIVSSTGRGLDIHLSKPAARCLYEVCIVLSTCNCIHVEKTVIV